MQSTQNILKDLLELTNLLAQEKNYVNIIEKIMQAARKVCNADVCFFFSINDDKFLSLEYSHFESLRIIKKGSDNLQYFPTAFLPDSKNKPKKSFAEQCAVNKELINCANIFDTNGIDISIIKDINKQTNYNILSVLAIPLVNRKGDLVGVAEFFNALDANGKAIGFNTEAQNLARSISSLASVIIENRNLSEDYNQLLSSFIEVLARAIDAKSPYTGTHCQRVPVIARMLATAAVEEEDGVLQDFDMNSDDWYAMHIASWLHDCGKVTTPEYIVDKATKLETIYNRIHEIRNRFEILRRDAHIDYLKKRLNNIDSQEKLQAEFIYKIKHLEDDFAFVSQCNTGDIPLTDEDIARLEKISQHKFMRYFNRMLGISWAERDNITNPQIFENPAEERLLQNLPNHLFGQYNHGELYNLETRNGTINKEEREKINEHIVVTINMLKALPFPKELSKVVEYAGAHHERVDGKGYPNGLTGEQMSIPAKIMAIADIFEALTANDRPYKEPKKLSEVLAIMKNMKNTGHIDPALYEVFIRNKIYSDYAEQYIDKSQIDEIIPEDYL